MWLTRENIIDVIERQSTACNRKCDQPEPYISITDMI